MTLEEKVMIVSFDSPTDPGATYKYDRETGAAESLFRPRPWLQADQLAGMRPVSFKARDGLTLHACLTTPLGVEPRDLPMVLYVHGGPWSRDAWGYDPVAQLLATGGYAVLPVNYRGSTGYGKAFYNAAVREFAGAMHNDLIGGVKWAIDEGIADPQRMGIHRGSYGGYATLIESFPAYWRPFLEVSWWTWIR